jgi:hypothetical protein
METRLDSNAARRALSLGVAGLVAMLALGAFGADADAKKKKKRPKNPATTVSAPLSISSSSSVTGTASCPAKTHATGGGFSVSPGFTPPSTGVHSLSSTSYPSGSRDWVAAGSAYATPSATGLFTTFARCERNTAGRIAIRGSSQLTLQPGAGQNMVFNCPPSAHAISGGYSGASLADFPFNLANHRIVLVQNRRTGTGQWTVSAFNNPSSPAAAGLTGYVVCEANAKGSSVTEAASPPAPIVNDGRTAADATCAGKKHTVSGGFLVSHTFPGAVPLVAVDEHHPVGRKGWHTGLSEYPGVILPAGATLQTFVYCKKG